MRRPLALRWLIPFTLVVMLGACNDSGDEAADATLSPTTTAAATTTTPAPTTAAAIQSVIPPDVEQTIDDYLASWAANDGDAFLATVTNDLLVNEYWYIGTGNASDGTRLREIIREDDPTEVVRLGVEGHDWTVTRGDEVVVSGDGPWFVAFEEVWVEEPTVGIGIATYVVEMIDGQPRITGHFWAGLSQPVEF
ncbi:MAG: nuclear transport factor 2 family protein [bacterium]|nr:nuclear transport factor 2 family protein [bacterium]